MRKFPNLFIKQPNLHLKAHTNTEVTEVFLSMVIKHRRLQLNSYGNRFIEYIFFHGATALSVGAGPPHYRSFTIILRHTPHSVGLLWTSDQADAETCT
jgi:hypothetical protein